MNETKYQQKEKAFELFNISDPSLTGNFRDRYFMLSKALNKKIDEAKDELEREKLLVELSDLYKAYELLNKEPPDYSTKQKGDSDGHVSIFKIISIVMSLAAVLGYLTRCVNDDARTLPYNDLNRAIEDSRKYVPDLSIYDTDSIKQSKKGRQLNIYTDTTKSLN